MKSLLALAGAHKIAATVVVAAVVVGGVAAAGGGGTTATVSKVVDGDTIDVTYDDTTHRVRLLNVNTPESVDPDEPVQCLGPEASEYLRDRLPVGTEVRLERDEEKVDGYGRELAAVFLGDELINASIAHEGLGVAMSVGGNTRYLEPVQAAQEEARAASRGLYSPSTDCTVPAQVAQLQSAAADTVRQAPAATAGIEAIDSYAAELVAVAATAKTVAGLLDGATDVFPLAAHTAAEITDMQSRARAAASDISYAETRNDTARAAEKKRLDDARKAAEAAARKAAEEAARKAAAEAARQAAERAAAEAAAQAARAAAQAPARQSSSAGSRASSSGSSSSGNSSSSGGSGYTGCRSYAPGGKSWTPITC